MGKKNSKPKPGTKVVLEKLPPGLLEGLLASDQRAIKRIVGKPVHLLEYDELGRAELEFMDKNGNVHSIWVGPEFIRQW